MPKRQRASEGNGFGIEENATPAKKARSATRSSVSATVGTPSGRPSILRSTPSKLQADDFLKAEQTPSSLKRVLFSTPHKTASERVADQESQVLTHRKADLPQKKSTRTIRKRGLSTLHVNDINDINDGETGLAAPLQPPINALELSDDEGSEILVASSLVGTPSRRGRPRGRRRQNTPSPPPDLPPHELFFFHHRAGGNRTSSNTLPTHLLLNHENYLEQISGFKDPHQDDIEALRKLHHRSFDQWLFELSEGFNICLYGYGSKRELLSEFAEHLCQRSGCDKAEDNKSPSGSIPKIIVVNGYAPGLTVRDVIAALAGIVGPGIKWPVHPAAALDLLLPLLDHHFAQAPVTLIIHSFDHHNLRKPGAQTLLSRIASHPSISLLATCDNPNSPLLWDTSQLRKFRWLYHDATTFAPYRAELEVVEDANRLLGRSTRRLGGKDGIAYVLRSLPENAQTLFRILVTEQLALGVDLDGPRGEDIDSILGLDDDDDAIIEAAQNTPSRRGHRKKARTIAPTRPSSATSAAEGVEYRALYHKAVEAFVCSSEVGFRTLLKEFQDHQIIESRKDATGTDRLAVPFRREELEEVIGEME